MQNKWAASWQNKRLVPPAKTQISLGIRPVWSKSSLCAQWVAKDPNFLHADSEDLSDWADAQAELRRRWAHMPFCWFCHEAAHMSLIKLPKRLSVWCHPRSQLLNVYGEQQPWSARWRITIQRSVVHTYTTFILTDKRNTTDFLCKRF